MSARLADNIQAVQQLAQTLHIVHTLKETAENPTASIQHLWEEIRRLSVSMTGQWSILDVGDHINRKDVEEHALTLLRRMIFQTKETLEKTVPDVTRFLPQPLADTFHSASSAAGHLLHQVREVLSPSPLLTVQAATCRKPTSIMFLTITVSCPDCSFTRSPHMSSQI